VAEEFAQNKTEAPTQRRREEARQQGRFAYSTELSAGLLLLGAVAALWLGARALGGGLLDELKTDLRGLRAMDLTSEHAASLLTGLLGRALELIGAFLGLLFLIALGSGFLQAGFAVTPQLLGPRWEKLSPVGGLTRMFSLSSLFRGAIAAVKIGVIALIAYWMLEGKGTHIAAVGTCSLATAAAQGWDMALKLALAIAAALLFIGLADYCLQRWRHEQSLWMTREEMKEEIKREEVDPMIRARVRKLQRERARQQMLHDVPRATVVVTNPTHLAIALRYERGKMAAPKVVAKGAGFVAMRSAGGGVRRAPPRHARPAACDTGAGTQADCPGALQGRSSRTGDPG
jgi:flagellar biosynthetic protein FlhB